MKIQDAVDYGKGIPNKIFDDEGNVFNRVEVNYPYMTLIAYKSQDKNIKINYEQIKFIAFNHKYYELVVSLGDKNLYYKCIGNF